MAELNWGDIHLGLIYPLRVTQADISNALQKGTLCKPGHHARLYQGYRNATYDAELNWRDNSSLFSVSLSIEKIICESKIYHCKSSHVLVSIYPSMVGTIQIHIALDEVIQTAAEAINLIRYLRTPSRTAPPQCSVACRSESECVSFHTFHELFEYIEEQSIQSDKKEKFTESISLIYPVFYVGLVPDCLSASDIISKYRNECAGLINLWPNNYDMQTKAEVDMRLSKNFHPLEYGASFISPLVFVELHPTLVSEIAAREAMTVSEHHWREFCFASVVCEAVLSQYYALRICENLIDQSLRATNVSWPNLFWPVGVTISAWKALRLEKSVYSALSELLTISLTRKSYTTEIIESLREQLGTHDVDQRIDSKLSGLNRVVSSMFQAATSSAALLLTIVAIMLTLIQLVG